MKKNKLVVAIFLVALAFFATRVESSDRENPDDDFPSDTGGTRFGADVYTLKRIDKTLIAIDGLPDRLKQVIEETISHAESKCENLIDHTQKQTQELAHDTKEQLEELVDNTVDKIEQQGERLVTHLRNEGEQLLGSLRVEGERLTRNFRMEGGRLIDEKMCCYGPSVLFGSAALIFLLGYIFTDKPLKVTVTGATLSAVFAIGWPAVRSYIFQEQAEAT